MNQGDFGNCPRPEPGPSGTFLDRFFRRQLKNRLARIGKGRINWIENGEMEVFGSTSSDCPLEVSVQVNSPAVYRRVALRGSVGAGESYMAGEWDCDNLTDLVRILLLADRVVDAVDGGAVDAYGLFARVTNWAKRNNRAGSRANIAAHYDLGNDFYRLFLDDTMMYSCAFFEMGHESLEEASSAKNDRICRKLRLSPNDHVLEIGTGWGGFALHAATRYGCRVTTTTISRQQYEYARQRVREARLDDRITVISEDYRDLAGQYDKLTSIEMVEAVGPEFYETFFSQCGRLLKPCGAMLLQSITIADRRYEQARKSVDFIKRHIFPGGCLPSVTALCKAMTAASDLQMVHLEDIGLHYATTLAHWRQRFLAHLDDVKALGFPDDFIRMWLFYFGYCEGAFLERAIGDVQLVLAKPGYRQIPLVQTL